MTYLVNSFDGNFSIAPSALDTTDTSLSLTGKDYSGWGQFYTNNFVNLLQNFAANSAPAHPRTGQLWFNPSNATLNIYTRSNNTWTEIGAPQAAPSLSTARNIALSGDATGSTNFDGSSNVTIAVTLADTGCAAGTYVSSNIVCDAKGRIVSITNGVPGQGNVGEVNSFNGRQGAVTLSQADVQNALTFYPVEQGGGARQANNKVYIGWTGQNLAVTIDDSDEGNIMLSTQMGGYQTALGYTPVNKGGDTMLGNLNFNGYTAYNLQNPINPGDAVNKSYADNISANKTGVNYGGSILSSYNVTVSSDAPSGGNNGDMWYRY